MGLFQEILDEIVGSAKGNMRDKIKQMIDQRNLIKTLNNMEDELDTYLKDNYGNETYYDSLYKYIHSGKVNQDTYSNERTSVFYYTLICAFLNSDDNYLGENKFCEYHWGKIKERYANVIFDPNNIKKCFSYYYNYFKDEFGCLSDIYRPLANLIIENLNNKIDSFLKAFYDGLDIGLKHDNTERNAPPEREDIICDNNNEYQERFNDTLFLESDINDGKKASLDKIYIEPHIESTFTNIKEWVEDRDSRILLLYGKAGIGKTSFTSWLSLKNDFDRECHILELRNFISALDSNNPWESIKKCFECMNDEKYQNKVLILDGLDEVCVLKSDFDGHEFIHNLNNSLKTGFGRSIRVIITSRMGYFTDIHRSNYIDVATIFWMEDSVEKWCEAYSNIHTNRTEWCEAFKKAYADLGANDKRKDVFCTPIILYICCVSQIDISKHDSVASIYDEAFNVTGKRRYNELPHTSQNEFEVNRQFTKELAFQMFLNDKLGDILSSDYVQIAKKRVVCWTQERCPYQVRELEFEKLYAINHFAYDKNNAIEFAHKTIGEYFTAVKLYEDYFEQIGKTPENTWQNIFKAFRYKAIPLDIMLYLVDLVFKRQDDNWKEAFFRTYYIGLEKQLLVASAYLKPEYSTSNTALLNQIQIAFRNLTWFLTGLGFDNSQFINTSESLQILSSYLSKDVNISGWKNLEHIFLIVTYLKQSKFSKASLKNANFRAAYLNWCDFREAHLEGAYLERAHLKRAHLEETHLERAYLQDANLKDANLNGAYLYSAHIENAHLEGAHLEGAHLEGAHLEGAHLEGAHLKGAHFKGSHLTIADIKNAELQGAYLDSESSVET